MRHVSQRSEECDIRHSVLAGLAAIILATAALAHGGVKNHDVMMRMEAMKQSKNAFAVMAAEAIDVSTLESLRAGVTETGKTCLDCHQTYREKKK